MRGNIIETVRRKLAALFAPGRMRSMSVDLAWARIRVRSLPPGSAGRDARAGAASAILSPALLADRSSADGALIEPAMGPNLLVCDEDGPVQVGHAPVAIGRTERMALDCADFAPARSVTLLVGDCVCGVRQSDHRFERPPVRARDTARPRLLTRADRRAIPTGMLHPRILPGPSGLMARITMRRRREPMAASGLLPVPPGYERDRALLAEASGAPEEDIKLVGVYCNVPITSASRLEFDAASGSLLLNIREGAAEAIRSSKRPVVTLIVGQVVSTGRIVRAYRPG